MKKGTIITIAVIVVVALAAVLGVTVFGGNKPADNTPTEPQGPSIIEPQVTADTLGAKQWAAFKAAVYAGQFYADPFEGLTVIPTNALPALSVASENDVYAIVGDFGYGALANFPNGEQIQIKVDDKTDMAKDLVKILGREYVAVAPIANRAFVNITAPAAV